MVRQLDGGFYGISCMHPVVKCLASQATKLLTHYVCETAVGCLLQISWELLTLELGMGSQPLMVDFLWHESWVTNSWLKSLWEKAFLFEIHFEEGKLNLVPPWAGGEWLMPMFLCLGFTAAESLHLN